MPHFAIPIDVPWWAWLLVIVISLAAKTLTRIIKVVFPHESQHRLEWWQAYFGRRNRRKGRNS